MTRERAREYRDTAREKQESGEYEVAGDYHSQAAFERAGMGTFLYPSSGFELRRLLEASTCYRVAGATSWCRNRAQMGALLAEELAERAFALPEPPHAFERAERGVWYEYIGDFRTVGDLDDPEAAYERAKETYRTWDEHGTGGAEQPQGAIMAYFFSVARAAGADMDEVYADTRHQPFAEWVEYKQARLPGYLDMITKNGSYPP